MGIERQSRRRLCSWFVFHSALLLFVGKQALAEIRYSIPEEVKDGTTVGNVAKDLGLDITSLIDRRFRVVSESKDAFFEANQNNGALYVHKKIDREELCHGSGACLMELKVIVENPLEIHYVVVEITDVNDHSPSFREKEQRFEIGEQTLPGRRFQLHTARDPDAGINSIQEVQDGTVVGNVAKDLGLDITSLIARRFRVVSESKDAIFEVNQNNGALYVNKHIDREELCQGSGACLMELKILVESPLEIHYVVAEITDVNDHSPSFPKREQTFEIAEQTLPGKRFKLHTARDPDAGINSIHYTSKCLQEANYDGTLCHSIQYRSGDKRYMLVGPRMSIGSTIVPGSHANTLVLPDRRRESGEQTEKL
ncbi:hypothetical protein ABVT39_016039 [Epinephelus coioides]